MVIKSRIISSLVMLFQACATRAKKMNSTLGISRMGKRRDLLPATLRGKRSGTTMMGDTEGKM